MACRTNYIFGYQNPAPKSDCSQSSILEFKIEPCDDNLLYPPDCESVWNNSLCDNDKPFYYPICESITGNLLYFQLQFFIPLADRSDGWRMTELQPEFYLDFEVNNDCCVEVDLGDKYSTIVSANTFRIGDLHFQNIILDTSTYPEKFVIHFSTIDNKNAYTHAFVRKCCNEIVQFEGVFSEFGCDGAYFKDPVEVDTGTAFAHKNFFATFATAVNDSFSIEKTTNRDNVLAVKREESLQIKMVELSPLAFRNLTETLSAKEVYVNSANLPRTQYNFAGTIGGLLAESRMYKPDVTLTRIDCEQNLKC